MWRKRVKLMKNILVIRRRNHSGSHDIGSSDVIA